jgi:tRNA 2-thiouridine synthesizing protein A
MSETNLYLQGLKCPLPVLRTRKALLAMKRGDIVTVECTDPLAGIDIPNLVQQTGDVLELSEQTENGLTFRIRKE